MGWSRKKVTGCEAYFSGTFSRTSPLSDRKVPSGELMQQDGRWKKTTNLVWQAWQNFCWKQLFAKLHFPLNRSICKEPEYIVLFFKPSCCVKSLLSPNGSCKRTNNWELHCFRCLQDEFDALDAIYTEEKRQLSELEERFKTLEKEYLEIMEARRIAKEKAEAAERELNLKIRAARLIQSLWRAHKARKALKSKKKKGKGKKGKKSGGKKKKR